MKYDLIVGYDNPLYVLYDLALVAVTEQRFCRFLEFGFGQPFQSAIRARLTARPHLSSLRPCIPLTLAAAGSAVHFVGEGIAAALPVIDAGSLFYVTVDKMEVDSITVNDDLGHLSPKFCGIEIFLLHDGSDRSHKLLFLDWTAVTGFPTFPLSCVASPPSVLPCGSSAEAAAAASAFHHSGEWHQHRIPIHSPFGPQFSYLLRLVEVISAYERLKHSIHHVNGKFAFIALTDMPLADVVFLQCHCARVGDVGEDVLYRGLLYWSPLPSCDSALCETLRDGVGRFSGKVSPEYLLDDLALGRNDAEHLAVPSVAIRRFMPVRNPLGESPPHTPPNVVADASALLLGKGCEQRQEQLSVLGHGINVLPLETDGDPLLFQLSDGMEAIYGVTGKTADAFNEHQINLSCIAVRDQPLELRPMRGTCACDTFVRIDTGVFPCGILLDETAVVTDLRCKGVVKRVHRDTGVGSHTQLFLQYRAWLNSSYLYGAPSFPVPYSRTIRTIASQYLKIVRL